MSKRNPKKKSRRRQKARVRQQRDVKAIKRDELRKKKLGQRIGDQRSKLTSWYKQQSLTVQILLGLIIIPIIITLILLQGIILPALAVAGGALLTFSKIALIWAKGGAFIVYISYKVFKLLLGIYLCISRSMTGFAALLMRRRQVKLEPTQNGEYPRLRVSEEASQIKLRTSWWSWKEITAQGDELNHVLLFSYLRYFIIGQIFMYVSFWREKMAFLTLWRAESREKVKEIFSLVGQTIFTPQLLGPHITSKRILVPGDARWISLIIDRSPEEPRAQYHFELSWIEWSFTKRFPFLTRETMSKTWRFETGVDLGSLSTEELGYTEREKLSERD